MAQPKSVVGMDVHATQTHVSVLDPRSGELRSRRLSGPPRGALDFLAELPAPVLAVYEAGPTGYGLARGAPERGLDVRVCAPGSIPRAPGDRVKTDRRDAERLARLLLAGELSFVRVPTPEEERFRDLTRCREAIRADLMRARHRVTKFLLRREMRWEGSACAWTQAHWKWLDGIEFSDGPSRAVLADYLCAVRALEQRRGVAERAIEDGWPESPWAETVARLRCLRGIDTLTALGLCAEAGDLRRFGRPASLMSYFGIVPSEYSSGEQRRRGPITKAGSPHARRLLVEAAQHYRHQPRVAGLLERRQRGADPRAVQIGWRAQRRLHERWVRLRLERGRPGSVVKIALARELGCFVWEVGQLS